MQAVALGPVLDGQNLGVYGGFVNAAALLVGIPALLAGIIGAGLTVRRRPASKRRGLVEGVAGAALVLGTWAVFDPAPLSGVRHALVIGAPLLLGPWLVRAASQRWVAAAALTFATGCGGPADFYGALAVRLEVVGAASADNVRAGFFRVSGLGNEAGRLEVGTGPTAPVTLVGRDPLLPAAFGIEPVRETYPDEDGVLSFDPAALADGEYVLAVFHDTNDDGRWGGTYGGDIEAMRAPIRHEGTLGHVLVEYTYVADLRFVEAYTASADSFETRQRVTPEHRDAFTARIERPGDAANGTAAAP